MISSMTLVLKFFSLPVSTYFCEYIWMQQIKCPAFLYLPYLWPFMSRFSNLPRPENKGPYMSVGSTYREMLVIRIMPHTGER